METGLNKGPGLKPIHFYSLAILHISFLLASLPADYLLQLLRTTAKLVGSRDKLVFRKENIEAEGHENAKGMSARSVHSSTEQIGHDCIATPPWRTRARTLP